MDFQGSKRFYDVVSIPDGEYILLNYPISMHILIRLKSIPYKFIAAQVHRLHQEEVESFLHVS